MEPAYDPDDLRHRLVERHEHAADLRTARDALTAHDAGIRTGVADALEAIQQEVDGAYTLLRVAESGRGGTTAYEEVLTDDGVDATNVSDRRTVDSIFYLDFSEPYAPRDYVQNLPMDSVIALADRLATPTAEPPIDERIYD